METLTCITHEIVVGSLGEGSKHPTLPVSQHVGVTTVRVLRRRSGVGAQVAQLQAGVSFNTRIRAHHLTDSVVNVPQSEVVPQLVHQAVRFALLPKTAGLHHSSTCV